MPEHHLLDLDSLPSAFEPCPECGDVMCQPDPWGEDCDDRARRRQAVATLEDQRRQAHALAAPAAAARARQQCLELTGSDGTHTSRAGARALDISTGPLESGAMLRADQAHHLIKTLRALPERTLHPVAVEADDELVYLHLADSTLRLPNIAATVRPPAVDPALIDPDVLITCRCLDTHVPAGVLAELTRTAHRHRRLGPLRLLAGGRPGYLGWDLSGWAHGMMRQDPAEAVSTHQPPFHLPESILNPAR